MTSYLNTNKILRSQTFFENLMKIWRDDVTWRHVTLFLQILVKKMLKVLENCWRQQKYTKLVRHSSFFWNSIITAFRGGVNHVSIISGSIFIMFGMKVLILEDFCWRHTQKCWLQQKFGLIWLKLYIFQKFWWYSKTGQIFSVLS